MYITTRKPSKPKVPPWTRQLANSNILYNARSYQRRKCTLFATALKYALVTASVYNKQEHSATFIP